MLHIAGHDVRVTSPDKVFFTARQETKLDLIEYYLSVGDAVMRQMQDRPVLLQRFPNGAHGSNFFQKRIPEGAPEWLQTTTVLTPNGTPSRALVIGDLAHIVWAVNLGCLGFHSWPVRTADQDICDELRIDLDPGPGTTYAMAQETAHETKRLLDDLGITGYIKTSGNRGLHVYVRLQPTHDSYAVRSAAVAVARELERRRPDLITAAWWKEERGERIFVDFNQNSRDRTIASAYSLRPIPGAPVSTPLEWEELAELTNPRGLNLFTVPGRLAERGDPWATIDDRACSLEPLLRLFEEQGSVELNYPPDYPKMPGEPPRVQPSKKVAAHWDDDGNRIAP